MNRNLILKFSAGVLFILFVVVGFRLAQDKPLWNDELYSQVHSVEKLTYGQILAGKIVEGNNFPLFYFLQKAICDVRGFHLPFEWKQEWAVAEPQSQIILRLQPIVVMALALTLIFYFFALEYSWLAGIYALVIALFTETVWPYFAEARPYALWYLLSAVQMLFFLRYIVSQQRGDDHGQQHSWLALNITHILLSLTAVFGVVQAFIVAFVLFIFYRRRLKDFVFMLFVSLALGFYYFFQAQHYVFGLPPDVLSLILQNISAERSVLIILCGVFVLVFRREAAAVIIRFGAVALLMVLAALAIMVCLTWTAQEGWQPFTVSSRYFIFLAPVGAITAAVFTLEVLKMFGQKRWMTIGIVVLLFLTVAVTLRNHYAQLGAFFTENPIAANLKEQQTKVKNKAMMITINHYRPDLALWKDHIVDGKPLPKNFLNDSVRYYEMISSYVPQIAEPQYFLGLCHFWLGDTAKGIATQEKAVMLEPRFFWSWYNLGVMYYQRGDFAKSGQAFRRALSASPQATVNIMANSRIYGEVLRSAGSLQKIAGPHLQQGYADAARMLEASLRRLRGQPAGINEKDIVLKVF